MKAIAAAVLTLTLLATGCDDSPLAEVEKSAGKTIKTGPAIHFQTTKGEFTIVTFPEEAPKTVEHITGLVKRGFYDGLSFHRVIAGFVAQGGDPKGDGTGGSGKNIPDELFSPLKHLDGSVAMAKSSLPNSADSQFYLCLGAQPHLDTKYTIWGHVIKGMDTVRALSVGDKMTKVTLVEAK